MDFDSDVISLLLSKGYSEEYGARPLKRVIEREIGDVISNSIIENKIEENKNYLLKVRNNKFYIAL